MRPLLILNRLRFVGVALAGALTASLPSLAMSEVDLEDNEYVIFHHHDALGSAVVTTGEDGHVLWHEHSEPFGRSLGRLRTNGQSLDADPFGDVEEEGRSRVGYTGHVRDGASDLVYMQARHYDPELGRFLSNDPVGFDLSSPMSFNRYAYANNNPYKYVDPDGRVPVVPLAIAAIGAGMTAYDTYSTYQSEGAGAAARSAAVGAALTAAGAGAAKAAGSLGKRIGSFLERMTSRADDATGGSDGLPNGLNPGDVVARRTTRAGDPAVRITREDGSVIDISPDRVKEYVPNTHPNAPPGTLDQVRFDNALPGSKGKKREPTDAERSLLDEDKD